MMNRAVRRCLPFSHGVPTCHRTFLAKARTYAPVVSSQRNKMYKQITNRGATVGSRWLAIAAVAVCIPAHAQSSAGAAKDVPDQLEEVVVSARLRDEKLQDVPASISALSGSQLENASAKNLVDVATLLPNFRFTQAYRPGVLQIAMRGIGTVQGGQSPVAVIVDGVQVPEMDFINQELLNVQSIEVLRGPQGALYGRGALVGAILINTKQPTNRISGDFRATYGNADTRQLYADISGPLAGDWLLGKLAVTRSEERRVWKEFISPWGPDD